MKNLTLSLIVGLGASLGFGAMLGCNGEEAALLSDHGVEAQDEPLEEVVASSPDEIPEYVIDREEAETLLVDDSIISIARDDFRVAYLFVTGEALQLEARVLREGEPLGDWAALDVATHHDDYHRAVFEAPEVADELQLRGEPSFDFARVAFLEQGLDGGTFAFVDDEPHNHELGQDDEPAPNALARPGRWAMPADVAAVANNQYVPYTRARRCSGGFLPGTARLGDFLVREFEGARYYQGYVCRTIVGGTGLSVHSTGRAMDLFVPLDRGQADNDLGDEIANYLAANAQALGIQLIIWDRSIYNPSKSNKFRYYGGKHPHHDHLHIELTPDAAAHGTAYPNTIAEHFDIDLDIRFIDARNPYSTGPSANIADITVGESVTTEIVVKNTGNQDLPNVVLGYWVEDPFVRARDWKIYDDHPAHDGRTWKVNSSDADDRNPPRGDIGQQGIFAVHKFSPGETKKIVLQLEGLEPSLGRADHPDIRVWVRHIDDVYGEQVDFFGGPTNGNRFGRIVRDHAEVDVLGNDGWKFTASDPAETRGWTGGGTVAEYKANPLEDSFSVLADGDDPQMLSPDGISVDTDRYDQMVLIYRAHDGAHEMEIFWRGEGEVFARERSIGFVAQGRSEWEVMVVPLDASSWGGIVTQLRVDPTATAPAANDSGWHDLRTLYFQNSESGETSLADAHFLDIEPVDIF